MDQAQFADQLLVLERLYLTKLALWAGISVLVGSLVFAWLRVRRAISPLLQQFALQCVAWGVFDLALVAWGRRGLELRDLAGATQLDRFAWFSVGLDVGVVLVGATLAVVGWRLERRLALVGAGIGVLVQGLALALLDLQLSAGILR
jgi:hypothetical protein